MACDEVGTKVEAGEPAIIKTMQRWPLRLQWNSGTCTAQANRLAWGGVVM